MTEIPINFKLPFQAMAIVLDNLRYRIRIRWNGLAGSWYMDLLQDDYTPIAMGRRLSANWNPLRPFTGSPNVPPGQFFCIDTSSAVDTFDQTRATDPDRISLGIGRRVRLLYFNADEVVVL